MSNGSSYAIKGRRFSPVTFLMLYFFWMRSARSLSARTRSRKALIRARNSGWVRSNSSRLPTSSVSSTVPSARMIRAEMSMRSLLAWTPQFMPEALLTTIPPTIADPIDAGSGGNTRPWGRKISLTRAPTTPGCSVMTSSSDRVYFSQCLPATRSTLSVHDCPERDVPAARNVTGR